MNNKNKKPNLTHSLSASIGAATLLVASAGHAASSVVPEVRAGGSHIDVTGVDSSQSVSDTGGSIDASVKFTWSDERGSFVVTPRIMQTFYQDNEGLEREEQRIDAVWRRLFERGSFSMNASYSNKDLFSSELEDATSDPGGSIGPDGPDSGLVGDGTRDRIVLGGLLDRKLSEKSDLLLNFTYSDTGYDENGVSSRVDYDQLMLDAGVRFALSPRTRLSLSAGGRRYDSDDDVEVDSARGQLRVDHTFSETLKGHVSAGYERLDGEQMGVDLGEETIVPIEAALMMTGERTRYTLGVSQYAQAVSTGQFRDRSQLYLRMAHQFSQKFSMQLGLKANRDEPLSDAGVNQSRDYFSGKLDLDYKFGRRWSVGMELYFNEQDFDGFVPSAGAVESRNEIFLNVRYRGLDRLAGTSSN